MKNKTIFILGMIAALLASCSTNLEPSSSSISSQNDGSTHGSSVDYSSSSPFDKNDICTYASKIKVGDSNAAVLKSLGEADKTENGYWYYYETSEFLEKEKQRDSYYAKVDETNIAKGDIIDEEMKQMHFALFLVKIDDKAVTEFFYDKDHKYSGQASGTVYDSWATNVVSKLTVDDSDNYNVSYYTDNSKTESQDICSVLPSGFTYKANFVGGNVYSSNIQINTATTSHFARDDGKDNVSWDGNVGSYSYRFKESRIGLISDSGVITSWDPDVEFPYGKYSLGDAILGDSRFYEKKDDCYYIAFSHYDESDEFVRDLILCDVEDKEEVIVDREITAIHEYAFENKNSVYAIRVMGGPEVQYRAFSGAKNLRKIFFNKSSVYLRRGAFYGCDKDKLTVYANYAQAYASNTVEDSKYSVCDTWDKAITFKYAASLSQYLSDPYYAFVYYDLGGGTNSSKNPSKIERGSSVPLYSPTKSGYVFDGWYLYGTERVERLQPSSLDDIKLTAKWTITTYSITYILNDGENSKENPSTYTISSDTITLKNPTKLGSEFLGWYKDSSFRTSITKIAKGSYGNITIYAKWKDEYSITYILNGGINGSENPSKYNFKSSIILESPTRTGYTFLGWYDEDGNRVGSIGKGTTGDITLTAKWNEGNEYLIALDANGGEVSSPSVNVQYAHSYSLPTPTRVGYEFKGWYNLEAKIPSSGTWEYIVDGDLKASWEAITYSIAYSLNGGTNDSSNPATYTVEDEVIFNNPTKIGYTFGGWYKDQLFNEEISTIAKGNCGDIKLYAKWVTVEYSITYNLNGGTNNSSNPSSYSIESSTITLKNPSKKGYAFNGWYEDAAFTAKVSTISKGSHGNRVLYAKWSIVTYSIIYNLNGGTNNSSNPSRYTVEDSIELKSPAKTGYTFEGWYDSEGNKVESIEKGTATNLNLTAKWNDGNEYVIALDANGGTLSSPSVTVQYGHSYALPVPTKRGYEFKGWYNSSERIPDNGDMWTYTTVESLKASWQIVNYEITYTMNGGTNDESNPSSYTVNDSVSLAKPTRNGYTFDGWYDEYGNEIMSFGPDSVGSINLGAKWSANKYSLNVSSNDETLGTATILSGKGYTDESIIIQAKTKGDAIFKGWYLEGKQVSTDLKYKFIMPASDCYFVAKFTTKEIEEKRLGITPVFGEDGKTVTYGLYPQKNVNDATLLSTLNALDDSAKGGNGWYLYDDTYYAKLSANPPSSSYVFENGTAIESGTTYWFKCEPITWSILENNDGGYYLLSSVLLDEHRYYTSTSNRTINGKTVYPNNYEHSSIREWLNGDFYETAFALGDSYIQTTTVDNSASTTDSDDNKYVCGNTKDKVFMPSYKDYLNSNYGFKDNKSVSSGRKCEPTDWALAAGVGHSIDRKYGWDLGGGSYFTRTPDSSSGVAAWCVSVWDKYYSSPLEMTNVTNSLGVRPAITLKA